MKSKKITLLILLLLVNLPIFRAGAITPQDQTVHITDTHDDMFITEVGIGIDTSLVTIKDPNMDIRAFLVFRELDINYWEPLENATLRLHTSNTLSFDADSSISIYGMALSDLQLEGWLLPSTVLSIGFTSAHTNYNTSQFYGNNWFEIDVTDIVEELIRNPNWDGDGSAGTETGDAIGFHILGDEGDDKRYFYDFMVGNGLEAQLVIHWNHEPPPPTGYETAEFNETYRGFDIWFTQGEWLNYSSFTLTNPDNNIGTVYQTNFTYTTFYEDDDDYLRKAFDDSGTIRRKFGVNYTDFNDFSGAEGSYILNHWGVSNSTGPSTEWTDGYSICTYQSSGGSTEKMRILAWEGGAIRHFFDLHPYWSSADLPICIFYDVEINTVSGAYNITLYNDIDMTDGNNTVSGNFGVFASADILDTEFAIGPFYGNRGGDADSESGVKLSKQDFDEGFIVADNGTVIDIFIDYPGAIEGIDDILGADPEDPNPPGEGWEETGPFTRFRTRLYILLLGFFMLLGPLFYMVARTPSGYEIMIGLFIMLIGYSFMRAAAGI